MRWMAMVVGAALVCAGCKDKEQEPVEVKTEDEAPQDKPAGEKPAEEPETKEAAADEDAADSADEDAEDEEDEEAADETKTAEADGSDEDETEKADGDDETKPTSTAAAKTTGTPQPFGAGGLTACCSALDAQSKMSTGSNKSRFAAASRQCFHLDSLVAQGKSTKGAALSQLRALAGNAPAACN